MYKQQIKRIKQWLRHENGIRLVVLLGVAGLAMILLSGFRETKEPQVTPSSSTEQLSDDTLTAEVFCEQLEQQLQHILEQMDGVGACQVMITASGTASYVYQQDESVTSDSERSSIQQQCVLISSSGSESPLIETIINPQISGVVIVCEGGDRNVVKEQITNAVSAALDLRTSQICIAKLTS